MQPGYWGQLRVPGGLRCVRVAKRERLSHIETIEGATTNLRFKEPPFFQGILKPERRAQESESSVLPLRPLWHAFVDFFAPEAQAAGPPYRVEFTYFAYLDDGNRERLKSKLLMEKETGSLPANHV